MFILLIFFNFDEENYRLDNVYFGGNIASDVTEQYESECDYVFLGVVEDSGVFSFEVSTKHTITFDDGEGYYYEILTQPVSKAANGEIVRFRIAPELNFPIDFVYTSGPDVEDEGNGWFSFAMPDRNIIIFVISDYCSTTSLTFEGEGYSNLQIVDEYDRSYEVDDLVNEGTRISFTFKLDDGYQLNSVTYGTETLEENEDGWYTFVATADTVVTIENSTSYTCIVSSDSNSVYGKTSGAYISGDSVDEGTTVYCSVLQFGSGGIGYSGTCNISVASSSGSLVEETILTYSSNSVTFTMPAEGVLVSFY